ncbi:MAG: hypothetical protein ABDH66_03860 [Bacteroidia bacterium]
MAACHLLFLGLIWAQGLPSIHYVPELRSQSPVRWIAVAWSHSPQKWPMGEIIANALILRAQDRDLAEKAESLGLRLYTWSGLEGAAVAVTVPRVYTIPAVKWLYDLLSRLQYLPPYLWHIAWRTHHRAWEGFSLERELLWRLGGGRFSGVGFSVDSALSYLQQYMSTACLHLIVSGTLSIRDKNQIQALRPPFIPREISVSNDSVLSDTPSYEEENIWAYPAYVVLQIRLPAYWPEKIAFLQAFLVRWMREAPPLRWKGSFWGNDSYLLQARLDGRSYSFLRGLMELVPRDSIELIAWKSAYTTACRHLQAFPEYFMDIWIPAFLRGGSYTLPDSLPHEVWQRGWPFQAQGIWLWNDWLHLDTVQVADSNSLSPSRASAASAPIPDFIWTGKGDPLLSEWASAIQLFWNAERSIPCELIGYYKSLRDRTRRLKYLHELRRRLIREYHIPPQALRVTLRPMTPGLPPKALRLKCTSDS